jgi:hypothetical protein
LEDDELLAECQLIYDTYKDILNVEATVKNPIEQAIRGMYPLALETLVVDMRSYWEKQILL